VGASLVCLIIFDSKMYNISNEPIERIAYVIEMCNMYEVAVVVGRMMMQSVTCKRCCSSCRLMWIISAKPVDNLLMNWLVSVLTSR